MNKTNHKKEFGQRVRYPRKIANLTQEELAEKTGLSPKTISYIENSKNSISFNKLHLLADALGVPIYKLFIPTDFSYDEVKREELNTLLDSATDKELNVIFDVVKAILVLI